MSLRLRLAVWYAGLATVAISCIALGSYVLHGRTQYLDIDRELRDEAALFAPLLPLIEDSAASLDAPAPPRTSSSLALFGADGRLLEGWPGGVEAPPLDAAAVIERHDGPAYDRVLALLPGGSSEAAGAFATVRPGEEGRVRLYALPVMADGIARGHVLTWTSLRRADASMNRFRSIVFGLAVAGIAGVWASAFLVARIALAPLREIIAAARLTARQRAFGHRVPEPERGDELSRLGTTLNEMLEALEDAYRAQQRFVADAAHELRAPLTAIRGNIELLARVPGMAADDREEAFTQLEQEAGRLSRLVEELLTLARSDAGQRLELHELDLDAVVLRAIADLGPAPCAARLVVGTVEPLVVLGNRDRLHQLVTILVDNGCKYTPAGEIRVDLEHTEEWAILRVTDTGIGIAEGDLPHVFERFFRADRARSREVGGSGLGLSIARWITEQHDGHIAVASKSGVGTTVTVQLPLPPAGHAPTTHQPAGRVGKGG